MDASSDHLNEQALKTLDKIKRVKLARRNKFYLRDEHITLSHGSGGKATHNLIEGMRAFRNPQKPFSEEHPLLEFGRVR